MSKKNTKKKMPDVNIGASILKKLLHSMIISEEGNISWLFNDMFFYHRYISLFLSYLSEKHKFDRKLQKLRYGFFHEAGVLFCREAENVLKRMKTEGNENYNYFLEEFEKEINKVSEKPLIKFLVYVPIKIDPEVPLESLKILDTKFTLHPYEEVKSILDIEAINSNFYAQGFKKEDYSYISAAIYARNYHYILDAFQQYFNIYFGIIAISLVYQKIRWQIQGIVPPLVDLYLTYIFIFDNNTFNTLYYYDSKDKNSVCHRLPKVNCEWTNELICKINNSSVFAQETLSSAFLNYYNGATEKDIDISFIFLWATLEIITCKGNAQHTEIVKRVESVLTGITELDKYELQRFMYLRNKLIHTGSSLKINQFERNLLKEYVDAMIVYFIFNLSQFSKEEVEFIYKNLSENSTTLIKNKKLIDHILSKRKGCSEEC